MLKRRSTCDIAELVSAGLDTIALRAPAHPVAQELLAQARLPIAAPSANRSGRVSLVELVMCLRVVNGNQSLTGCQLCDPDSDGPDLRDLVLALRNATDGGCR